MKKTMTKTSKLLLLLTLSFILCSCIGWQNRTIQQGNIITEEKVSLLKVGMDKVEVVTIMGTPILTNTFDSTRLNYVYTLHKGHSFLIKKKLVLHFVGNRLTNIEL